MRARRALLTVIAAALLAASCGGSAGPASLASLPTGTLSVRGSADQATLRVWIAETESSRERGLMNVTEMDAGRGMAFLFDQPTEVGFWMKDTLIPLSIAYWTAGGRIVAIREMTPCHVASCPVYAPGAPYVGAVEANRGFFAAHGIAPGDRITLRRS